MKISNVYSVFLKIIKLFFLKFILFTNATKFSDTPYIIHTHIKTYLKISSIN